MGVCYNCSEEIWSEDGIYFDDFDGIDRPVCKKCHAAKKQEER